MTSNKDMPAMPSGICQDVHNAGQEPLNTGLTKLEHFARLAMQGILSNSNLEGCADIEKAVAVQSIKYAEDLLAQLEEKDCE